MAYHSDNRDEFLSYYNYNVDEEEDEKKRKKKKKKKTTINKKKFSKYDNKDEEFWTYDDYGDYKEEEYDDDEEFSMYSYNDDDNEEEEEAALGLEKLKLGPKKKLVVFNLNGLLIHRDHKKSPFTKYRSPDGAYGLQQSHIIVFNKRPFLEEFMKFCLQRFEVGIWSSAQVQSTNAVVGSVLQEFESRFLFVWDQDYCSDYGYKLPGKKKKPMFFKELSRLWSSLADNSILEHQFYGSNTLLIDNEPYKALLNPPNTGIFLDTYDVKDVPDNTLDLKNEVVQFLEGLAEASDVPSYVKSHPIGQPAVGPTHPDWDFYSRICRLFKD